MIFGIIHLLHCPCLIILPFCINNPIFTVLYIEYFFGILFLYTFINGECPISYIYKKRKDPNYIAGSRIADYPEMSEIFFLFRDKEIYISVYFGATTILYIGSLIYVINRSNIPFFLFVIPTNSLFFYFYFLHKCRTHPLFYIIQEFNKTILFLFILCLNISLYYANILNNFFVHISAYLHNIDDNFSELGFHLSKYIYCN